eukprot:gene21560-26623_t
MLLYLEEKLRKRTTTGTKAPATDGDVHAGAIDRQGSKLASTAELEGKVDGEDPHAMGRNGHASRSMSRVTSQTNVGQSAAGGTNMSRSASQDRHHVNGAHQHDHGDHHRGHGHDEADIQHELSKTLSSQHDVVITQSGRLMPMHPLKDPHVNRQGQRQTKLLEK